MAFVGVLSLSDPTLPDVLVLLQAFASYSKQCVYLLSKDTGFRRYEIMPSPRPENSNAAYCLALVSSPSNVSGIAAVSFVISGTDRVDYKKRKSTEKRACGCAGDCSSNPNCPCTSSGQLCLKRCHKADIDAGKCQCKSLGYVCKKQKPMQ